MRIALDVDGVLADVIQTWLIYNNRIRKSITKNEITEWNFWEKFQIDRLDFSAPSKVGTTIVFPIATSTILIGSS